MDERLLNPISTAELERRWTAVRKVMAERKIDALVMQNNNDWLGGYVRWFTDTPLTNGYIPRSVIFPAHDLMITGRHGRQGRAPKTRWPRRRSSAASASMLFTPAFTSVAYTDEYQAEIVAAELKRRGYRTIGWVGSGAMPYKFVTRVERELEGTGRNSSTRPNSSTASRRSRATRKKNSSANAREMQDEIFARVLKKIKPGMSDNDLTALAQYEGRAARQRAGTLPRLVGAARTGIALCRPPLPGAQAQGRRALLPADREQRSRRHVYRDRAHHRARQGLERADRRLRIDEGGAGAHAAPDEAGRVLRRHRRSARRLHAQPRLCRRNCASMRTGRATT